MSSSKPLSETLFTFSSLLMVLFIGIAGSAVQDWGGYTSSHTTLVTFVTVLSVAFWTISSPSSPPRSGGDPPQKRGYWNVFLALLCHGAFVCSIRWMFFARWVQPKVVKKPDDYSWGNLTLPKKALNPDMYFSNRNDVSSKCVETACGKGLGWLLAPPVEVSREVFAKDIHVPEFPLLPLLCHLQYVTAPVIYATKNYLFFFGARYVLDTIWPLPQQAPRRANGLLNVVSHADRAVDTAFISFQGMIRGLVGWFWTILCLWILGKPVLNYRNALWACDSLEPTQHNQMVGTLIPYNPYHLGRGVFKPIPVLAVFIFSQLVNMLLAVALWVLAHGWGWEYRVAFLAVEFLATTSVVLFNYDSSRDTVDGFIHTTCFSYIPYVYPFFNPVLVPASLLLVATLEWFVGTPMSDWTCATFLVKVLMIALKAHTANPHQGVIQREYLKTIMRALGTPLEDVPQQQHQQQHQQHGWAPGGPHPPAA